MCVDIQGLQGPFYALKKHAASSGIDPGAAKMDGRVIETRTFRSLFISRPFEPKNAKRTLYH
jgi:hypothetical protein